MDHHTGDNWFIHGHKRHKENQLQSLELICWLFIVYSMLIWWPFPYYPIRCSKKNARGRKYQRKVDKYRNSIPNVNHFRHIINVNTRYRTASVQKGQATIGHHNQYHSWWFATTDIVLTWFVGILQLSASAWLINTQFWWIPTYYKDSTGTELINA